MEKRVEKVRRVGVVGDPRKRERWQLAARERARELAPLKGDGVALQLQVSLQHLGQCNRHSATVERRVNLVRLGRSQIGARGVEEPSPESLLGEARRVRDEPRAVEPRGAGAADRLRERLGPGRGVEDPGGAVDDRLEGAPLPEGDDRRRARLGFEGNDPEVLLARHQDELGRPVELAELLVGRGAGERDVRPGEVAEAPLLGPEAGDDEREAEPRRGRDRVVDAFVRGERRDDEQTPPLPGRR